MLDVPGFDWEATTSGIRLLGPTAYETSGPIEGGANKTTVGTLSASPEAGLVMVVLDTPTLPEPGAELAVVTYSYTWLSSGETELHEAAAVLNETQSLTGGLGYFTNGLIQRNICLLRTGMAIGDVLAQSASNTSVVTDELEAAGAFCADVDLAIDSPDAAEAHALTRALLANLEATK